MMVHKNNEPFIRVVTKFIKLLIIANIGLLQAQYTAIPDPNFEQELINQGIDSENTLDGQILTNDINTVTSLFICCSNIGDMTGIQDFTALTRLSLYGNESLARLDLSHNTLLSNLSCVDNWSLVLDIESVTTNLQQLRYTGNSGGYNLNIGNKPNLTYLDCGGNLSPNLDISQCPNLEILFCNVNTLSYLDTSHNPNLWVIDASMNSIDEIDLSSNLDLKILSVRSNNLERIDLNQNVVLEQLLCDNNALVSIDIQNNANSLISNFDATNNPNLQCIFVDDKVYSAANWTSIDANTHFVETVAECNNLAIYETDENSVSVYPNPATNHLFIDNNSTMNIENISIYNIIGQELIKTTDEKIDVSNLTKGTYFLKIYFDNGKGVIKTIQKE